MKRDVVPCFRKFPREDVRRHSRAVREASPSRGNPMAAKKKRQDPFREIQNCLQKRDYKSALGWFQTLLERENKNTQIRLRYADTLVLAGSKNEAIKQYRIVADELAESGFMIRAIAINKKIVQLDPRQTDVYQKLAEMNETRSKGRSAAMAQLFLCACQRSGGGNAARVPIVYTAFAGRRRAASRATTRSGGSGRAHDESRGQPGDGVRELTGAGDNRESW